tara:strand:- start:729 stop:1151 length:423 start_codon:yes stop_codon:yes gene_type:complete
MNMGLMNSFTKDQLELCEPEDLIRYILCLRSRAEDQLKDLSVNKFIEQQCKRSDNIPQLNGEWKAPTCYGDLYYRYRMWHLEEGKKMDYSPNNKKKIKGEFLKWQQESPFGLSLGKNLKEGKPNGSERHPYFNLVVIEED